MAKNPVHNLTSDERAASLWQPRAQRRLNTEDYRQIRENLTGFFEIFREWSAQEERKDDESA